MNPFRRRRADQSTIADLEDANTRLQRELAHVRDLLDRRTQALLATERENEALHLKLKELGPQLHAARHTRIGETQLMTRRRSDKGGPSIDLTQPGDETQLMTSWRPA